MSCCYPCVDHFLFSGPPKITCWFMIHLIFLIQRILILFPQIKKSHRLHNKMRQCLNSWQNKLTFYPNIFSYSWKTVFSWQYNTDTSQPQTHRGSVDLRDPPRLVYKEPPSSGCVETVPHGGSCWLAQRTRICHQTIRISTYWTKGLTRWIFPNIELNGFILSADLIPNAEEI